MFIGVDGDDDVRCWALGGSACDREGSLLRCPHTDLWPKTARRTTMTKKK